MSVHTELDPDAGAPGVTLQLAQAYRALGHQVDIASFKDLPSHWSQVRKSIAFPYLVAKRIRLGRYDVVDASTGDAWAARLRAQSGNVPQLVTRSHGLEHTWHQQLVATDPELSWKYPLYHGGFRLWEVARSLRIADRALFLNERDRTFAVQHLRLDPDAAIVVRNGIPDDLVGLPPPPRSTGGLTVAVIGTYLERKGTKFIADALGRLLPHRPGWRVTFLGTRTDRANVLIDYDSSVHDQLTVIEHYRHQELPEMLAGHHAHLFPTLFEGGPLSLLESMACGLAPVVSNIPGPAAVIRDRWNGILIAPADPDAVTAALVHLDEDRNFLDQLRVRAQRSAQTFAWSSVASEQLSIYRSIK